MPPEFERRQDDGVIRERLGAIEATLKDAKAERGSLIGEVRGLSPKIEALAVAQAQLAAAIAAQSEQRIRDRQDVAAIELDVRRLTEADQRRGDVLAQLLVLTKDIPSLAAAATNFTEMRADLKAVVEDRQQRRGMVEFGKKFAMIVGACAALVATLAALGAWAAEWIRHLKPPTP